MPRGLDVVGDDIWFGGLLVGRLLLPTSSVRDDVELLVQQSPEAFEEQLSALEAEHKASVEALEAEHAGTVAALEWQIDTVENEAAHLRETLDAVEVDGAATVLKDLTDALRIALADNDRLRAATETPKPKAKSQKPGVKTCNKLT